MGKQNMKNNNINNNDKNLVLQYFGNSKEIDANNFLEMVNDKDDEGEEDEENSEEDNEEEDECILTKKA